MHVFESPRSRAAGVLALLAVLAGLLVWYGSLGLAPGMWVLPGETHLAADYERYVGERVEFQGTVTATDPVVVESSFGAGPAHTFRATLTGVETDVEAGDRLAIYGVARPDHTIEVRNAYRVPRGNYGATYLVSALAGLWVLGRLALTWRVDPGAWALVPREDPPTAGDVVDALRRRGGA